ncbi:3-oxoacid CoA-transferase subunit B [Iocasia frigidifontis]|uniref:3-oxoacid CoA-transferase subunit B n=1 Tax=Iocasia fonsfrigidae TaxID=2682810 RepID=A0A8A7KBD2_9FIRM|nr:MULTISPECIES: CoA transferase subunit B [Halanaerobiaceae]AZO96346.1 CoA transferase subunit B [Halocella sp. SP3-1]QTL99106.1 3-oxoacid CoA-transferase subunit B [Iocasia fonsfrigidae]
MNYLKAREKIARRVAREFEDGDLVNLGIGLPTMVADYIEDDVEIILHSENGFVGLGPAPVEGEEDKDITNAGGQPVTIKKGGAFFDSVSSFMIIRGGHLDATVLGALQVDQEGNLANWMIPGKMVPGMGGAMDLTVGARRVIVATQHVTKKGQAKILKKCNLPLTARKEVDLIVTELAVMEFTEKGLVLKEIAKGVDVEEVIKKTEAELIISEDLKEF